VQYSHNHRPIEDPLDLFPRGLTKLYSAWVSLTYPFASIGSNVSIHFTTKMSRQRATRISLGDSVYILDHAWLNVATDDPGGEPTIVIQDGCSIGSGSIVSGKNRVLIERDVLIGQQVVIQDHNHSYENVDVPIIQQGITKGGTIRIGEGSWIGRGAAILCSRGELTIGKHCVISANSVVTRSIPDYSVVFGMPAAIIRQYDPERKAWRMGQFRGLGAANRNQVPVTPSPDTEAELSSKP
jgi:acetyltransferase-like isoleucine patch superfamily enzyme